MAYSGADTSRLTTSAEATCANGAIAHPEPQVRAEMAGPEPLCFTRWQQHFDRQQAEATDEVSHCAVRGESDANQSSSATGTAAARRVQWR
jgi:hypothetical protein